MSIRALLGFKDINEVEEGHGEARITGVFRMGGVGSKNSFRVGYEWACLHVGSPREVAREGLMFREIYSLPTGTPYGQGREGRGTYIVLLFFF